VNTRRATAHDMLIKGLLLTGIGLGVLLAPVWMAPSSMRDTLAQAAVVGWFSLVLGLAFAGHYLWQRRKQAGRPLPPR
jgi:uncharacterized membrane protein HdeD (DUF308 family)